MANGKSFEESVLIDIRQNVTEWYREEHGDWTWTPPMKPDKLWNGVYHCYAKGTVHFIDIDEIEIYDTVQRTREDILKSPVFRKMEAEFDPQLFQPCVIVRFVDDNCVEHNINVDGQGRQVFGIIHGFPKMPCTVIVAYDWEEVKSMFFKFNNENRFEHLKKSCKWDVLRKQGDKDVEDDLQNIMKYFSTVEMPGTRSCSDGKTGLFSGKDFHDYFRYTTFHKKSGGYECKDLKINNRKVLLKPYSIIRKGLNQDVRFTNWSEVLYTIWNAIRRFDREHCDLIFEDLFVQAPEPLPFEPKFEQSYLGDYHKSLFGKDSDRKGIVKEALALRLLALCSKCKMINPAYTKSKLGTRSVYANLVNELRELKDER